MKYLSAVVLLFVLSLPVWAETSYEQNMSAGMTNLESKDYGASEQSFRAALKERPDDYRAILYLGTALNRRGNKEAEGLLKKSLRMNPQDPKPSFELGVYYYNKSVYPEAKDYFETVIELAPETESAAEAKRYLARMEGRRTAKRWKIDAALGGQYDSNVILGPQDGGLPEGITGKSDWRALVYLRGQYDFLREENFSSGVSYALYQSLHARLSDFNVSQHTLGINAVYDLPKLTLKGTYAFEYVFVGGDDYDSAHTVTPSVAIKEGRGLSTTIQYQYSWTRFRNAELFSDNSDRTGSNNQIGVTQAFPLGNAVEARGGYAYDHDNAKKDFWDYNGNKIFLNLGAKMPQKITLDLYGEYYDKDYKGEKPDFGAARKDKVQTYSLTLSKGISDRVSVAAGQLYVRNKSNIDVFDYKRAITSLYVTVRF